MLKSKTEKILKNKVIIIIISIMLIVFLYSSRSLLKETVYLDYREMSLSVGYISFYDSSKNYYYLISQEEINDFIEYLSNIKLGMGGVSDLTLYFSKETRCWINNERGRTICEFVSGNGYINKYEEGYDWLHSAYLLKALGYNAFKSDVLEQYIKERKLKPYEDEPDAVKEIYAEASILQEDSPLVK